MAIPLNAPGVSFGQGLNAGFEAQGRNIANQKSFEELKEWMSTAQRQMREKDAKVDIMLNDTMLDNPELFKELQTSGASKEIAENIRGMDQANKDLLISVVAPLTVTTDRKQLSTLYKQALPALKRVDPDTPSLEEFTANQDKYLPILKLSYAVAHQDRSSRQLEEQTRLNHTFDKENTSIDQKNNQANIILKADLDRRNAIDLENLKSSLASSMGVELSDVDKLLLTNSMDVWKAFASPKGAQEMSSFAMPLIQTALRMNGIVELDEDDVLTESWLAGYSADLQSRANDKYEKYKTLVSQGVLGSADIPNPLTVMQRTIEEDIKNGRFQEGKFITEEQARAARAAEEAVRSGQGGKGAGAPQGAVSGDTRTSGTWRDSLKAAEAPVPTGLPGLNMTPIMGAAPKLTGVAKQYKDLVGIEKNILTGIDDIINNIIPKKDRTDQWGISQGGKVLDPDQQLKVDQLEEMKGFIQDFITKRGPSMVNTDNPNAPLGISERELRKALAEGLEGRINKTLLRYL